MQNTAVGGGGNHGFQFVTFSDVGMGYDHGRIREHGWKHGRGWWRGKNPRDIPRAWIGVFLRSEQFHGGLRCPRPGARPWVGVVVICL